ncbi:ROK family protein [Mycetocola zhadangensis]|uniref:ROK family transcriptional regulator n=1 Tax=Mycetocola zhadangensis TaxID=1164595 RepID=A0A3L7J039_9MICO|nr:ROK family transcriptional regulator [Mycetocola zhadangensis]RLQ82712.1 ROK family transcriptional regulator [Mycetocola zhadangensis]
MSNYVPPDDVATRRAPTITRQVNDRLALDLFAQQGPLSRTQVRDILGVSQPTAIDLIKRLESAGHIQPVGEERQTRPGPRAVLYGLVSGRWFVAGANIRDRKISAAIGDLAGGPALETVVHTVDRRPLPDQIVDAITTSIRQAGIPASSIDRTVVGVPGIVDEATGDLGFSWDLPRWRGRLLEPLRQGIASPLQLLNGVQLAAMSEGQADDLRHRRTFALMWVGTGVGLCLMVNGSPLIGASGAAGEIGYTPVPGAPVLPVRPGGGGFEGDLQSLIGAHGLRSLMTDMGFPAGSPGVLLRRAGHSRDERLQGYLGEVARRIAVACASIASVVDPGLFVLQGSTSIAGGVPLAARVEEEFRKMSPLDATVITGRHHEQAELEGALHLGRALARRERWGGDA